MLRLHVLALAVAAALSAGPAGAEAPGETAAAASEPASAKDAAIIKVAAAEGSADAANDAQPAKPAVTLSAPTLTAKIDLASQSMTVYEDGVAKYSWPISSGTAGHPTPRGTFHPQWTAKMWYSRKYDNAPMPNAVFINGGVAIHGTPHVGRLGSPASHGCIRLAPGNAKAFYNLVHKHGLKKVRVSVVGTPNWRAPAIASHKANKYAAEQPSSGGSGWSWLFGSNDAPVTANKPKLYKNSKGTYYILKNGSRVYVQKAPKKTKYYYSSSN